MAEQSLAQTTGEEMLFKDEWSFWEKALKSSTKAEPLWIWLASFWYPMTVVSSNSCNCLFNRSFSIGNSERSRVDDDVPGADKPRLLVQFVAVVNGKVSRVDKEQILLVADFERS